ncbi:hypothetical protein D4R75_00375 [bacterium]|nr:MAG: hypothetical protein D4R75_00375 [bacterium]
MRERVPRAFSELVIEHGSLQNGSFFLNILWLERQEFMARLSMRKVLRLWNFKKQKGNDWKMSLATARRGICKEKILLLMWD